MDQAFENGRKVALVGRSMMESTEIAQDLGYIDIPDGLLIHPAQISELPPDKVCVLISGTQGEPMSALSRAAVDNHKHARIQPGDTVVLSSRIIPGNEKAIYRVDRSPLPPRCARHLRRRLVAAGARQRTRQPGRAEAHHQPGEAAILHSHSRRVSPAQAACRAGRRDARLGRQGDDDRERRHSGVRRAGRAQGGQGQRRPHLHRFELHGRCGGGPGHSRPPSPERRRHRAADHRHQQADRRSRERAGDRDARLRRSMAENGFLDRRAQHRDEHAAKRPATKRRATTA